MTRDKVHGVQKQCTRHADTSDLVRGQRAKQRTRQYERLERTMREPARHRVRNRTCDRREKLSRWHIYTKQVLNK
jgi:hypothetical protein